MEEFARDFNYTVNKYIESVSAYQKAVAEVEQVNELGERVVNLVSMLYIQYSMAVSAV